MPARARVDTAGAARWGLLLALVGVLVLALLPIESTLATGSAFLNHFLAFYGLALLLDFAFPRRPTLVQKLALLLAFGVLIELLQLPLAARQFALMDIVADALGVFAYFASAPLLRRLPLLRLRFAPDRASRP